MDRGHRYCELDVAVRLLAGISTSSGTCSASLLCLFLQRDIWMVGMGVR